MGIESIVKNTPNFHPNSVLLKGKCLDYSCFQLKKKDENRYKLMHIVRVSKLG